MGINYAVSDHCDADGLAGEPIDQRTLDVAEALKLFVDLTHDVGANIGVSINRVDEAKVIIYCEFYLGVIPSSNPKRLHDSHDYGFYYMFEKDPQDGLDAFDKFMFAATCIVKAVPWICHQQVLRRVVGGDKLAYQPA